jgi:hypothetical protein
LSTNKIYGIKVRQWLKEWEEVEFSDLPEQLRRKPEPFFYMFSLPAAHLKRLTGVQRRSTDEGRPRHLDPRIQRRHEKERSDEIRDFVRYGYPWSELSQAKRQSEEYLDLRKPGWLPTAIIVNILTKNDERAGRRIDPDSRIELIPIDSSGDLVEIAIPSASESKEWEPQNLPPLEVIDGQHRLWAFEDVQDPDDFEGYELPVVAFHGLDISWQAYLFWAINVKPKRINPSLAFDLYPLLRSADWLEKFHGHSIYRETRSQELVEALWSNPDSPWYQWINMLGEPRLKKRQVSQAAWVRSLQSTFVKASEGPGVKIGGLFGSPVGTSHETLLPWSSSHQAAFLIHCGRSFLKELRSANHKWIHDLIAEDHEERSVPKDSAFYGPSTLLNTDQGIRAYLHVLNDMFFLRADDLRLPSVPSSDGGRASEEQAVVDAIRDFESSRRVQEYLQQLSSSLAEFDWRAASSESLSLNERTQKLAFRGSGGYRELRRQLLHHIAEHRVGESAETARRVLDELGFDQQ